MATDCMCIICDTKGQTDDFPGMCRLWKWK